MRNHYSDEPISRDQLLHAVGVGNWRRFLEAGFTAAQVREVTSHWAQQVKGLSNLWLCWAVHPDWCLEQQKQVLAIGWTPVVGYDPRNPPPPVMPGAVLIDFNAELQLPTMWMHFPLEFAHWWAPRLAFWHSDLLLRGETMRAVADWFSGLSNGQMAATKPRFSWRETLAGRRRYWELLGCTTRKASEEAFIQGCGWWMGWPYHPMATPAQREYRKRFYWDHGAGIRFWHKRCGGHVVLIPESMIAEGHFTRIGNKTYQRQSPDNFQRDLAKDLPHNFNLADAKRALGLV